MSIRMVFLCLLLAPVGSARLAEAGPYYVDSQSGSDANPGTISSPWKSIDRVNQAALNPGDSVFFKRGCQFRGRLVAASGNASADLTYGAYGTGAKPLLLGSVDRSDPSQWTSAGGNIWATGDAPLDGTEMLANPSFDADASQWTLFADATAGADAAITRTSAAGEFDSPPAGCKITCASGNGNAATSILLSTQDLPLRAGQWYAFYFRAKASSAFSITNAPLLRSSNYAVCSDFTPNPAPSFTSSWATYRIYYHANQTVPDGRVFLLLGQALPVGGTLYLDTASFQACSGTPLAVEVGNLIFNNQAACGTKQQAEASLAMQGDFWYDNAGNVLKMYSTQNPGQYYARIECATNADQVSLNNCSYAVFEDLDLRYGGAHGMNGTNLQYVRIRDCDFSYIGGGQLFGLGSYVRYGNAVQFWQNAHDCWVQRCRIDQIYDTGITNQGSSANQQYNLYYQNNVITNCQWSIEIWNQPAASSMNNIYVENNTCVDAGFGWSYPQRQATDQFASHLTLFANPSTTASFVVRNNIFSNSKFCLVLGDQVSVPKADTDYNCFYQPGGSFAAIFNTSWTSATTYSPSQWPQYQSDTGHDSHSLLGDPQLGANFTVLPGSRCVDAGYDSPNVTDDFSQNPRPAGAHTDIGAFEYIPATTATPAPASTLLGAKPFLAFPNPAHKAVNILIPAQVHDADAEVVLYNLAGEAAGKLTAHLTASVGQVLTWNAEGAAGGIYLVQVTIHGQAQGISKIALLK